MSYPVCPCNLPDCVSRRPVNRSPAIVDLQTQEIIDFIAAYDPQSPNFQPPPIPDIEDLNRQNRPKASSRMPSYRIRRPDGRWVRVYRYERRNRVPQVQIGEDVVGRFASHAEINTTTATPTSDSVHLVYDPAPYYLADHFDITRHLMNNPKRATYSHFHPEQKPEELNSINPVKERLKLAKLPGGTLHVRGKYSLEVHTQPESIKEFANEVTRMKTFKRWRCFRANVSRLAFAGFVYNETENHIECFSCRLTLKGGYFTVQGEPVAAHLHLSKWYCPHLYSILGDTRTLVEGSWFDNNTSCLTRQVRTEPLGRIISNLGGPVHLDYANPHKRRKNFEEIYYDPVWKDFPTEEEPTASSLKNLGYMDASKYPTHEELIDAGLFCTNMYTVCCYYCGMRIEMWPVNMRDSSPTAVHDLFFPQCFLSQIRNLPPAKPVEYLPREVPEDGEVMDQDDDDNQVRADPTRPDCKLCLQNEGNILSITCGHVIGCSECMLRLQNHECPFCRTKIGGLLQMYI